jgi:hypothetical protein
VHPIETLSGNPPALRIRFRCGRSRAPRPTTLPCNGRYCARCNIPPTQALPAALASALPQAYYLMHIRRLPLRTIHVCSPQAALQSYERQHYVLLKGMYSAEETLHRWGVELHARPSRQAFCGDPNVTWTELQVPLDGDIALLFQRRELLELIAAALRRARMSIARMALWASAYQEGEYIGRHVDNGGHFQIVFCIEPTPVPNGGALLLQLPDRVVELHLERGDALLFRADQVEHWTSPVIATANNRRPRRTTIACRYWFN